MGFMDKMNRKESGEISNIKESESGFGKKRLRNIKTYHYVMAFYPTFKLFIRLRLVNKMCKYY